LTKGLSCVSLKRQPALIHIITHILFCIIKYPLPCLLSFPTHFFALRTSHHTPQMEETKSKFKRICVYCGSSSGNKASYQEAAVELGEEMVILFPHFHFFLPFYNHITFINFTESSSLQHKSFSHEKDTKFLAFSKKNKRKIVYA